MKLKLFILVSALSTISLFCSSMQVLLDKQLINEVTCGNRREVGQLLEAGANVNTCSRLWPHESPLIIACKNNKRKIVGLLLEAGANVNVSDFIGFTPLLMASDNDAEKIMRLLLKAGANVNVSDSIEFTPLLMVSDDGYEKMVRRSFLNAGATVNKVIELNYSLLGRHCLRGHYKIVEMLLKAGMDVNICDSNNRTPLHVACSQGHKGIVRLLLEAGADIHAVDNKGKTPSQSLDYRKHSRLVKFLVSRGADIPDDLPQKRCRRLKEQRLLRQQAEYHYAVFSIVDQHNLPKDLVRLTATFVGGDQLLAAIGNRNS